MRKLIVLIAGIALLVLVPTAGSASPPLAVEFVVPTTFGGGEPSYGPFTATGPAVDDGLVCARGDTLDVAGLAAGLQSTRLAVFQVVKQFTCDDSSGEFYVKLQVLINQNGDNFQWAIVDGTGEYEGLRGTGKGVGLYDQGADVVDVYIGKVHSN